MKALVYERSPLRYALANLASHLGRTVSPAGPVQLRDVSEPKLPTDEWVRVTPLLSGICGSDLSTVSGRASGYFEQVVSFPFVLGHEVVGQLDDGTRVVLEPALGCVTRGIEPLCSACANGDAGLCHNAQLGDIKSGLQIGFCRSTGGGWSSSLVAHMSQIHAVPEHMSDAAAVMVEPVACGVHAVRQRADTNDAVVAVIGAGTLGLSVIASLREWGGTRRVIAAAKHPHQQQWARELGADTVVAPSYLLRAVRTATESILIKKALLSPARLAGGADVVFDCVGNSQSITSALSMVRPGGRVVLVGMPASVHVDLAPFWQREVELVSAYCYSHRHETSDFAAAMSLVDKFDLGRLVTATYPLEQYKLALGHAANAGARGAVKIAFDLRRNRSSQ